MKLFKKMPPEDRKAAATYLLLAFGVGVLVDLFFLSEIVNSYELFLALLYLTGVYLGGFTYIFSAYLAPTFLIGALVPFFLEDLIFSHKMFFWGLLFLTVGLIQRFKTLKDD